MVGGGGGGKFFIIVPLLVAGGTAGCGGTFLPLLVSLTEANESLLGETADS